LLLKVFGQLGESCPGLREDVVQLPQAHADPVVRAVEVWAAFVIYSLLEPDPAFPVRWAMSGALEALRACPTVAARV